MTVHVAQFQTPSNEEASGLGTTPIPAGHYYRSDLRPARVNLTWPNPRAAQPRPRAPAALPRIPERTALPKS